MENQESIDQAIDRMRREREMKKSYVPFPTNEDLEQQLFLAEHGKCQERTESAFVKGMLIGGLFSNLILVIVLRSLGVI